MATLEQVSHSQRDSVLSIDGILPVFRDILGREVSESEVLELSFDLLEFFDALTGESDDTRESC